MNAPDTEARSGGTTPDMRAIRSRYNPEHVSILNTLDHGGEMHAFELGSAQSVSKMLAKLRRDGLVYKRVASEGVSALWSITDDGRAYLSGETQR